MAIDKNSAIYKSILAKGYTDAEVEKMVGQISSGQNAKDVIANMDKQKASASTTTKATTTTTTTPKTATTTTPTQTTNTSNTNLGNRSYGSDTEARQQEIRTNLDNAYAKNPTQFASWESFANAFNYNNSVRSDKERETMKNWYESKFGSTTPTQATTPRKQVDATYDKNGNLHISYSDGSTEIIPGNTGTQQGQVGGQTGLSADGKTYTFLPGYEPIYPEGEIASDKSTAIANQGKLQQKSKYLTYQEDTPERYNQILGNLEDIYLKNPEYFTNRTTFDANFQIDQRSIGQQQLMVQWFYQKKKQEKDLNAISGLNDGQSIYDAVNGGGLTSDQLDLLKGTPQYDEYINITKDKTRLAVINNDPSSLFIDNLPKTLDEIKTMIMLGYKDMDKYKPWEYMMSLYDGPDYDKVRSQLEKSTKTALDLKAEYDSIDSRTRSELEGTGATKGYVQALTARRQNDMIPQLNMAYAQVQADQTNWNLRHQSVTDLYGSYVDEANYEIDKYNARIQGFQTMWNTYKDVAQYDWEYKQKARLLQLQESYTNPQIDSDDPDEARRALQSALQVYYDTYGPIIKRDINKTIEDIYAYAKKNGVSLSTALQKNFVDQLQAKPEYKELKKQAIYGREYQKAGTASKSSSSSSSSKSSASDGSDIDLEGGSSWWRQTADVTDTSVTDGKVTSTMNSFIKKYQDGGEGGTDEDFVNEYLNALGLGNANLDSSLYSKISIANDVTPAIGSVAVDTATGEVGIVTGIEKDKGRIEIKTSDMYGDGKVSTYTTKYLDDIVYINPSKALTYQSYNGVLPNTEFKSKDGKILRLNDKGYLDALSAQYKTYIANGEIAGSVAGLEETLDSYGISGNEFRSQAQNYKLYGDEAQAYLKKLQSQYNTIKFLYNNIDKYNWVDNVLQGASKEFSVKYENFVKNLTLNYFTNLKAEGATFGSMTEGEWKLVGDASTTLVGYQDNIQLNKKNIKNELYDMAISLGRIMQDLPAYKGSQVSTVKKTTSSNGTTPTGR